MKPDGAGEKQQAIAGEAHTQGQPGAEAAEISTDLLIYSLIDRRKSALAEQLAADVVFRHRCCAAAQVLQVTLFHDGEVSTVIETTSCRDGILQHYWAPAAGPVGAG